MFWARQPAETVHFAPTLTTVLDDHPRCLLVEAGPGNSLSTLARRQRAIAGRNSAVLPLLPDRTRGDEADIRSVEQAWCVLSGPAVPAGAVAGPHPRTPAETGRKP